MKTSYQIVNPQISLPARFRSVLAVTAVLCLAVFAPQTFGASTASDTACNDTIGNGNNGGTGFAAWANVTIAGGNVGGVYTTTDANLGSNGCNTAWGIYTGGNSSQATSVQRPFTNSTALSVGQKISVDLHNGGINAGGSEGLSLYNSSGNAVWEFFYANGNSGWTTNTGGGSAVTPIPYAGSGCRVSFTLTSATTYSLTVQLFGGSTYGPYTGTLSNPTGGASITQLRFYAFNIGSGNNLQFNNIGVSCPDTLRITNSPASLTNCANTTFTYTVSGISGDSPTYQWQVSTNAGSTWSAVTAGSGGTTASYSTNATAAADGNQFRCVVTDACGNSTNSLAAYLSITANTSISAQPQPTIVCQGSTASFSITATGVSAYQWQVSGDGGSTFTNVTTGTGTNTANYTTAATTAGDSGKQFICALTGCSGNSNSTAATLTVNPTSVGGTATPAAATVCTNTGTTITLSGNTGTIQWQSRTGANAFASISGATNATVSTGNLGTNTDFRAVVTSGVCSSSFSTTNTITVSPTSVGGTVAPATVTVCSGSSTTLTNTGFTGVNQWQSSTDGVSFSPIANATNATVSVSPTVTTYYYSVVTSGACSSANSTTNTVTVNTAPTSFSGQPLSLTNCSGSSASLTATANGTAPSFQWRKGRWNQNWSFNNANKSLGSSTANAGGTSGGINSGNGTAWKLFNPPANTTNEATRALPYSSLGVGQTFQIDMDNGFLNASVQQGFELRNASGNAVWSFYFQGGGSFYVINAASVSPSVATGFTGNGLRITLSLTTTSNYTVTVISNLSSPTTNTYTGTLLNPSGGQTITDLRLFARSNGGDNNSQGLNGDLFFNNLVVENYSDNAGNYSTWTGDASGIALSNGGTISGATTTNLVISSVASSNAVNYDVIASNACGSITSSVALLTVTTPATITAQPVDQSVCVGVTATFSVTASNATAYQWQVSTNGGSTYDNVSGGTGATSASYTTPTLSITDNTNKYQCLVSGTSPCAVATSTAATLTVTANSSITIQPGDTTVCQGSPASFTLTATAVIAYQWQVSTDNGATFSNVTAGTGGTTATYSTNATAAANGNQFQCVLTGCSGNLTSTPAILTVNPTSVGGTATPSAATVCSNSSTTITLSGNTGTIQWQSRTGVNTFANIGGETNTTVNTGNLGTNTDFRAVVTSGVCSSAFSTTNTISVNSVSVGGTVTPATATVCSGNNTTLTNTGFTGVNQWQASVDGVTFTNIPNATNATLSTPALTQTTYYKSVVTSGVCSFADSTTNTVTVNTTASISGQPLSLTNCSGTSASLTVTANGTAPNFQWRKRGAGWGTGNAWALTNGGGGFFVGASTNNGGGTGGIDVNNKSWGLFSSTGGAAEAVRNFTALSVGQVFQVDMDNGSINTNGPTVGFGLRNASGQNMLEFYFRGGQSFYEVNKGGGSIFTGLGFTANGVRVTVTVTSATTFSLTVVRLSDSTSFGPYTGTFLNSGSISQFRGFNFNAGAGSAFDLFFNSLKVGPSAATPFFDDNASSYTSGTWTSGSNLGNSPLANGGSYTNVATASLTINPATSAQAGSYDVVVYNSCGGETSAARTLTVNPVVTANPASYTRTSNLSLKISVTNLLSFASIAGGGTPALTSVSTSTNGTILSITNGFVFYTNSVTPNVNDIFTYTVTDTNTGCTADGLVSITVVGGQTGQTNATVSVTSTNATVTYFGVPGSVYIAQRSTNLASGIGWVSISTNTAPTNGLFQVTDDFSDLLITVPPIPSPAFYRLMAP